jgi:hypothetical protein
MWYFLAAIGGGIIAVAVCWLIVVTGTTYR